MNIEHIGEDEYGFFFTSNKTIFYPQGGGQPNDLGYIHQRGENLQIIKAKYGNHGIVKHYTEKLVPADWKNDEVVMRISPTKRKLNAAYHTAGHWLSQIINENLQIDLMPVKGHHFTGEAYVEFDGESNLIHDNLLDNIKLAMRIDLQSDLQIKSELATMDSPLMKKALLPKNFKPIVNRPLRLVTIDGYKPVPCGGTHYDSLRGIKSILPIKIYKKGKRIRLSYECTIWQTYSS